MKEIFAFLAVAFAQGPGGAQIGQNTAIQPAHATVTQAGVPNDPFAGNVPAGIPLGPWTSLDFLEGTWSTKSETVITGPDFYDPVDELLIEPGLPGMSYSFTSDGYFEEALYQVVSNGTDPLCSTASLIYQHGTYNVTSNGTLYLNPFGVDGRMLLSDPCHGPKDKSTYLRFEQVMKFDSFFVEVDPYHGRYRLNLFRFDGAPLPPMYLVYKPPQMLPTMTMNPTASQSGHEARSVSMRHRIRRSLENRRRTKAARKTNTHNVLWYGGVGMMVAGGISWALLG